MSNVEKFKKFPFKKQFDFITSIMIEEALGPVNVTEISWKRIK